MHPSRKHQKRLGYSQQLGFVALASLLRSFGLQNVSVPTPSALSTCNIWLPWKHYATSNGIFFKVKVRKIRHAIKNALQNSLLLALRANERAKCGAAFGCHDVKVWVGTDKCVWRFTIDDLVNLHAPSTYRRKIGHRCSTNRACRCILNL